MAYAIDVRGLSKRYGQKTVVDDVALQLAEGRICGFLGPNGSGKTTTLRMLCGLLTPDAGEGTCLGFDIRTEAGEIKRRTGYMTQRFSLYEDLTIEENLAFIEGALGKDIQKYFLRDFFNDHVKRYKKRPIYWLFSSPQGSFNALIYMHRYRPDTVGVLLNDYLRVFRSKLEAQKAAQDRVSISADATAGQRSVAMRGVQAITKQIDELDAWERDVIYPMATRRIEIDLDDGVKANYPKFAGAVKTIKGLEETDD